MAKSKKPEPPEAELTPLAGATWKELVDEMRRRCTAVVMLAERPTLNVSDDMSEFAITYFGGWSAAYGLLKRGMTKFDEHARIMALGSLKADYPDYFEE